MNKFEPNKLVKECMVNKDIMGLKGALIGIIFSNRSLSNRKFDNTLKYIATEGINIYEKYDGEDIICNTVKGRSFTEDDFAEAVCSLEVNFCQERINDVKKISKQIYGDSPVEKSGYTEAKNGENSGKKQISHQTKRNPNKQNNSMKIVTGIAVVAAIAVAVGWAIKMMK